MNKKLIWLILLLVLVLAACSADTEEEPVPTPTAEETVAEVTEESPVVAESADEERITVRFALLDIQQGLYGDLVDGFEEENPDVEIKFVSVEEILELESLASEPPDDATLRLVSAADVSSFFYSEEAVRDEMLLDLTPFMEADPNFDPGDFHPQVLENFQAGGSTWALPTAANYRLLFLNKDAFDQAGVDYPQAGWSWDDFLATAEALTLREGDETLQWGFVEASANPSLMVQSRTDPLFNLDTDPPEAALDTPEVAEALRWYTDLFLSHEVSPYYGQPDEDAPGLNIPEGYMTIESGQAAMWPEFTAAYPYRSQQMNLGVLPWPVDGPDSMSNTLFPDSLAVSVGTANPEAAWRWVDYLSRQSTDLGAFFGGASTLPARLSTTEASGFWDEVEEELGDALLYAIDHAFTTSYPEGGVDAFYDAFYEVMDGEKTVEEALADAQIAAEEAISDNLVQEDEPTEEIVVEQTEEENLASDDAVTIEFVSISNLLGMQGYRELAKQYLDINPDIVVELKQPNVFQGTPTLEDIAAESDCFEWFPGNFNDADIQAAILNLDPFLDADGELTEAEFYPVVFDAFTAQGQAWGLPAQVNVNLIEYNKDLFDAAGLEYPSLDWTTIEFLDAAVALTEGDGETKQYGYLPALFEPTDLLGMLDRLGVTLIDNSSDPPAIVFDDATVIENVRWYTGLTTEHAVKPVLLTSLTGAAVTAVQKRETLLNEGLAAMWVSSAFDVDFSEEGQRNYSTGAVPLPTGTGEVRGSGYQSASGYFISANTELRDACWQWINFLTGQPNAGRGLPGRLSVAESDLFRQQAGPEVTDVYLASAASATQPPFSQQISDENSWLSYPIFWLTVPTIR